MHLHLEQNWKSPTKNNIYFRPEKYLLCVEYFFFYSSEKNFFIPIFNIEEKKEFLAGSRFFGDVKPEHLKLYSSAIFDTIIPHTKDKHNNG